MNVPEDANDGCVGVDSDLAGKAESCAGCPNQSACADGKLKGPDPAVAEVSDRMSEIKHKILVLSGKGGVGKSTFAAQLTWALAGIGKQVGILDIDICGPSVPRMLGVEEEEVRRSNFGWTPVYAQDNLAVMSVGFMLPSKQDAIIWRGPRKNGLIKQFLTDVDWSELDFLVVDAPPGTSDEHISIAQYTKTSSLDGAIIVTTPQEVSLLDVRKEITFCRKTKIPIIGVVENMSGYVCPNCNHKSDIFAPAEGGAEQMAREMKVPFLGSIPLDPQLLQACERGCSVFTTFPDTPAAKPFKAVIRNVLNSSEALRATVGAVNIDELGTPGFHAPVSSSSSSSSSSTSEKRTATKRPREESSETEKGGCCGGGGCGSGGGGCGSSSSSGGGGCGSGGGGCGSGAGCCGGESESTSGSNDAKPDSETEKGCCGGGGCGKAAAEKGCGNGGACCRDNAEDESAAEAAGCCGGGGCGKSGGGCCQDEVVKEVKEASSSGESSKQVFIQKEVVAAVDPNFERRLKDAEAGASKWQKISMGLASAMVVMAGMILRKF